MTILKWKDSEDRKPLIVEGARQVGKTYLIKEFGQNEYNNIVYINCHNNSDIKNIFTQDLNIELAIQWLIDAGLVYKVHRCKKPDMPLKIYEDFDAFKLYLLDVGLLGALSGASAMQMLANNNIFKEFRGSFTENYVLQQLYANKISYIYYYSKDHSTMEIDYLIQYAERIIPIEVKAEENVKSKSLSQFVNKEFANLNMKALRCSMKPYIDQGWLENIPLYSINGYFKNNYDE